MEHTQFNEASYEKSFQYPKGKIGDIITIYKPNNEIIDHFAVIDGIKVIHNGLFVHTLRKIYC